MQVLRDMTYTLKTARVTGAGGRIGRATAQALAGTGRNVLVHARRSEAEAAEVCRLAEQRGVRAWPISLIATMRIDAWAPFEQEHPQHG
jgi:NAD(P)-dependent dehydrogenase (short-subunit alcohol dehydrogenase family)